jgi:rod shape determining protein RodA
MNLGGHHERSHQQIDWLLLAAVCCLMVIGIAFVYSASFADPSMHALSWTRQIHVKQALWYAIGVVGAIGLCFIEYHTLARWSLLAYWGAILLLIAVLIPGIGSSRGWGSQNWIDLGPFSMQPSEFAKVAFILMLGNYLSRPVDELKNGRLFWKSMGLAALPFGLIMLEPDLGSALVFFPAAWLMMFVAGVPAKYLFRLVGGGGTLIALLVVNTVFMPASWHVIKVPEYQRARLLTYFGQNFAPADATPQEQARARLTQRARSYNVDQALISVGSGGLFGKGWRQGTQYSLGFLPRSVAHNDFIFSIIAEETGFVGSVAVVALYTVVLFCGLRTAGQSRDRLGKILAVGVVTLLFVHVFINIGMNIRLVPVTGIPLPLLSYGGSSVLCSLLAIGLLFNVYYYRRSY